MHCKEVGKMKTQFNSRIATIDSGLSSVQYRF